jgi:hypothetical protein
VTGGSSGPARQRLFGLVGALAITLVAIVYFLRGGAAPESAPAPPAGDASAAPTAEDPQWPPRRSPQPPAPAAAPYREEVITSDGLPIMPARDTDPRPDGPVHPHPITPQHERIFAENRLIGALDGAMDVKDAAGMRKLLEQYRREYPEDDNQLQEGYAVVADCFDRPGAASRAAAERWLTTHNGSPLKRWVNRHCLEPPQ